MYDTVFDVLADEQRRELLFRLLEHNPQSANRPQTSTGRERANIQNHHLHYPKLKAMAYIEWDRDSGEIHTGENYEEIRAFLEFLDGRRDVLHANEFSR